MSAPVIACLLAALAVGVARLSTAKPASSEELAGNWLAFDHGTPVRDWYVAIETSGQTIRFSREDHPGLFFMVWIDARLSGSRLSGTDENGRPVSGRISPTHDRISLEAGENAFVLVKRAPPRLSGRVVEQATGSPIAGARVAVQFDHRFVGTTDKAGRFDLGEYRDASPLATTPFTIQMEVRAPGFAALDWTYSDRTKTIDLEKSSPIRGDVRDADGRPVAKAEIRAYSYAREAGAGFREFPPVATHASAQGAFELLGLPESKGSLHVTAPGFAPRTLEFSSARGPEVVHITLEPTRRIRGVVTASGAPVPGAGIALCSSGMAPVFSIANSAGEFTLEIPPHRIRLASSDAALGSARLTIDGGARGVSRTRFELALRRTAPLSGRILDDTGQPVESAAVSAQTLPPYDCDSAFATVLSDSSGRFVMNDLPPGLVQLEATPPRDSGLESSNAAGIHNPWMVHGLTPDEMHERWVYEVPGAGLVLMLPHALTPEARRFHGHIVDAHGSTLRQTSIGEVVRVWRTDAVGYETLGIQDGNFEGAFRSAGEHVFQVCSPEVGSSEPVKALAGFGGEITLRLPPTGSVTGRVLLDGKPTAGIAVEVGGFGHLCAAIIAETDRSGRFDVKAPAGAETLALLDGRSGRETIRELDDIHVNVNADARVDLGDLELPPRK